MDGLVLLETLGRRADLHLPRVVVHTARTLTRTEHQRLQRYAETVIQKAPSSSGRVLEEVRAFVSLVKLQPIAPSTVAPISEAVNALRGRRILLTDDDMRTVYALSALLRSWGAEVLVADTGVEALSVLEKEPSVDVVLMDVMMPEMNGYEAMRRIRGEPRFAHLPVFALTASALQGERERCLDAGANDYLAKPLESAQLLGLLQGLFEQPRARAS
jgi:CheY-like chemotaxis protein